MKAIEHGYEEQPVMVGSDELEQIEIELLLDGVHRLYGYDFRNYALPSLKRRIWHHVHAENVHSISALQEKVLHDRACFERFVYSLSIPVTEMFRDPGLFLTFRQKVVPLLRTYPYIRIWHAGCSTGEEVYSMAILLHEEGLYDKARIYATDMNERSLQQAKEGVYDISRMKQYTKNYLEAGGTRAFSEYYTAKYNSVILQPYLRKNIIFAEHNLATDTSFNEFNVIFCRNVMIYFNDELRDHVHGLFHESLSRFGILVLGSKESIHFTKYSDCYESLDRVEKIYRNIK
ncbi:MULTISPECIES: protein-glutamate O-methyltransferase CheR [Paenibacillus]|jgi:chemotaxis protein methyltransferase CheR|uniref:Chemotaxis protein CheR n=1 Tax=Paenibacillus odorifer TaxID=189426 RepID=A0A1R0X5E0_9BACL|nr:MULTISPECIES: protein-glutamate O-methyltransferase CheR [Paenibacillus]ETT62676.1 CheR-type MCP methyltransferase [Paenibacillus sp. FSL H8-237]MEC0132287.1 protein-glutamate O-methyltransferase CheR [Paenibacillus odorifer]MEC0219832.1 protein-glutamate O-methyltransferase CheR [Paenibacillus odorifer]OMC62746.1 chemotaxis protein CheR [Paenibacillus odorifer]OMC74179.1 chemotaxis protein CheR [Paenibacillus odorifer]